MENTYLEIAVILMCPEIHIYFNIDNIKYLQKAGQQFRKKLKIVVKTNLSIIPLKI
jgi:hypothetical protein